METEAQAQTQRQHATKKALRGPALTLAEFQEIVGYLVGRTQRSIKDKELQTAFKDAFESWQL